MKKAIVTGAAGFLGGALTKQLLQNGIQVYGIDINKNKLDELKQFGDFIAIVGDCSTYNVWSQLLPQDTIDVFFHLAWQGVSGVTLTDDLLQWQNADVTYKLMVHMFSYLHLKKFIFCGSSYEYKVDSIQIDKYETQGNPSIYGAAKYACRKACESYSAMHKVFFNSFSFTNVFGVGDYSNRSTNTLLKQFYEGISPKLIEGTHLHDWVYISDAVAGMIAVAEFGQPLKQYYIGAQKLKTFREIVQKVRDIVNPNIELQFGTYADNSYIDYSHIDLLALYNDTSFVCSADFKESILRTEEWVKTLNI